jgi:hypothetical protein
MLDGWIDGGLASRDLLKSSVYLIGPNVFGQIPGSAGQLLGQPVAAGRPFPLCSLVHTFTS